MWNDHAGHRARTGRLAGRTAVGLKAFDVEQPETVEDALELLAAHGEDARLLAGGQSLLILLRQRLVAPEVVVDVKRIPALAAMELTPAGAWLGATLTYASIAAAPAVRSGWPLLARAAGSIGSIHIRERGTVGGALAHSDPAGDVAVALMALDGAVVTRGPGGERRYGASDFPTGLFSTRLEPGGIVTGVEIPVAPRGATYGYERFLLRDGEFPLTQAAIRLEWQGTECSAARVAVGGGFERPARLAEVESMLVGARPDGDRAADFRGWIQDAVRPYADVRGSRDWKAAVVAATAGRAFTQAIEQRRQLDA